MRNYHFKTTGTTSELKRRVYKFVMLVLGGLIGLKFEMSLFLGQ